MEVDESQQLSEATEDDVPTAGLNNQKLLELISKVLSTTRNNYRLDVVLFQYCRSDKLMICIVGEMLLLSIKKEIMLLLLSTERFTVNMTTK